MILHCFYQSVLLLVIVLTLTNANFIQSSSAEKVYGSKMGMVNPRNDPCSAAPLNFCKNNGICYIDGSDKFACHCRYPYIGKTCEEESGMYCSFSVLKCCHILFANSVFIWGENTVDFRFLLHMKFNRTNKDRNQIIFGFT